MARGVSRRNVPSKSGARHPNSRPSTDPRFANLSTDPRYSLPSRKHTTVKIDKRFAHMLHDDDFSAKASVDRYGRRIPKGSGKKKLERMYQVESSEDESDGEVDADDEVRKELARVEQKYDPARQGGFSESSSSESEGEGSSSSSEDVGERDAALEAGLEHAEPGQEGPEDVPMGEVSSRIAVVNLDWDHIRAVDIMAVANSFCPPDGRILDISIYPSDFGMERMEREELEGPPKELFVSKKLKAKIEHDGSVHSSRNVSPSDDNAPSEGSDGDDDQIQKSILAHASAPEPEIDSRALRVYQLSRLRYFYAIISCSSSSTAHALYTAMDGREYLSTANFFDLRFVPDDLTFDYKARDTCEQLPEGYRPEEFVTEALTHSKVRLTWDDEDQRRKEAQKRAFGTQEKGKVKDRAMEMDKNDLRAYVGSDSNSSEADDQADGRVPLDGLQAAPKEPKSTKSEQARRKMREALGLPVDDAPSASNATSKHTQAKSSSATAAPAGNMHITFSAGLTPGPASGTSTVFQKNPPDAREETTREKYIRKEKERKARRNAKLQGTAATGSNGDEDIIDSVARTEGAQQRADDEDEQQDPFDDPFFTDPVSANAAARKAAKHAKRESEAAQAADATEKRARERAQLELLMDDGELVGAGASFDMAAIRKAEKEAAHKGRKGRKGKARREGEDEEDRAAGPRAGADDFELDVADPRFSGVFEDHEFAIDPSNPRFSGTKGMKRLLEEGRRKRRVSDEDGGGYANAGKDRANEKGSKGEHTAVGGGGGEVEELVKKIKRRKAD